MRTTWIFICQKCKKKTLFFVRANWRHQSRPSHWDIISLYCKLFRRKVSQWIIFLRNDYHLPFLFEAFFFFCCAFGRCCLGPTPGEGIVVCWTTVGRLLASNSAIFPTAPWGPLPIAASLARRPRFLNVDRSHLGFQRSGSGVTFGS